MDSPAFSDGPWRKLPPWTIPAPHGMFYRGATDAPIDLFGPVVHSLGFSSDRSYLACGRSDGAVFVWRLNPPAIVGARNLGVVRGQVDCIRDVAVRKDGLIVAVSLAGYSAVLSLRNGEIVAAQGSSIRGDARIANLFCDGRYAVIAGASGTIFLRDVLLGRERSLLRTDGVLDAGYMSPQGRLLAVQSNSALKIFLFDVLENRLLASLVGNDLNRGSAYFSRDERQFVFIDLDEANIVYWRRGTSCTVTSPLPTYFQLGMVPCVALSPDGQLIALSLDPQVAEIWATPRDGREMQRLGRVGELSASSRRAEISCLAFSPDSKFLAIGTVWGNVNLWDWRRTERIQLDTGSSAFQRSWRGPVI